MIYGKIYVYERGEEIFVSVKMSWEEIVETIPILLKPSVFGSRGFEVTIAELSRD